MQLCKILGEEEAVQTGVNLVDNSGPRGDGGLGVRVEEDILGSGGGGLRFRQDLWTSAEAAALGAAAGYTGVNILDLLCHEAFEIVDSSCQGISAELNQ
uniref:Uncharacterized protein n=1 Tax=Oryza barthii TaxID=65489 RepID=A0A0D3HJW6_9ORYZ